MLLLELPKWNGTWSVGSESFFRGRVGLFYPFTRPYIRKEMAILYTDKTQEAMAYLKKKKCWLTVQQYRTIKGQILAGDEVGAIRGIDRVIERNGKGRACYATQT